jgi:hypothetical protein
MTTPIAKERAAIVRYLRRRAYRLDGCLQWAEAEALRYAAAYVERRSRRGGR